MSVAVSIACGHDAWYLFKTTGAAESLVITGQCGAGYYPEQAAALLGASLEQLQTQLHAGAAGG